MYPCSADTCRSYGATVFVSRKFYKHGAPTALKWVFQQTATGCVIPEAIAATRTDFAAD